MNIETCNVALKEWSVTCEALRAGRQIVLLRKGGILDEDGVFHLEQKYFWLQPTFIHQDETLVKPDHRDLFARAEAERIEGENKKVIALRLFAQVEQVWTLREDDEDKLRRARHIWSDSYLDVRFNYKPEHPLLCVALRVSAAPEPHVLSMREKYFGCRSWIDLDESLATTQARAVLDDTQFARQMAAWREALSR